MRAPAPADANQIGPHLEQRIVAFALAHPAFGPGGSAPSWPGRSRGGLRISEHGVWRVLVGLGLNTRAKRLALVARHRDPYERVPSPCPAFTRRTNWRTLSTIVSAMTLRRCWLQRRAAKDWVALNRDLAGLADTAGIG